MDARSRQPIAQLTSCRSRGPGTDAEMLQSVRAGAAGACRWEPINNRDCKYPSMSDREADYNRIESMLVEAKRRVGNIHDAINDVERRLRS